MMFSFNKLSVYPIAIAAIVFIWGVSSVQASGNQVVKYVCPMHPQIIRDHESSCPICGMDLVQQIFEQQARIIVSPKSAAGDSGAETAAQGNQFNFAIKTAPAQKITLWKYVPTFGYVKPDETRITHVHPFASGWIRSLAISENGQQVKKGQLLYRLYSPEMVVAQHDYILSLKDKPAQASARRSKVDHFKIRLVHLGFSEKVIQKIRKTKAVIYNVPFYAEKSGTVEGLSVKKGMYIEPNSELFQIQDLSRVWIEAQVLPLQQQWVKEKNVAEIRFDAFPGTYWEGDVDYIYPKVDPVSRALKVRIPLLNKSGELKPDMLASVGLYGGPKRDVLAIPLSAVIDTGDEQRVVKQLEEGGFEVVPVVLGMQSKGVVEILNGLTTGDRIVTSGQFLLDSESQILTNLQKLVQGETSDAEAEAAAAVEASSDFEPVDSHAGHNH